MRRMEYNKILFSRLLASFFWTVALQVIPLSFYILLTNFDALHPGGWIKKSASTAFSFGTWIALLPLQVLIFAVGYLICEEHKKPTSVLTTRFKVVCSFFTKINFLKFLLYLILGILLSWTYLNINNFPIWVECQELLENSCMNENTVFLITCGAWSSIFYFIRYDILAEKHLQFPLIRQLKFLQIRYRYLNVLNSCFTSSFLSVFYYLPFYMWYRRTINLLFELLLNINIEATASLSGFLCLISFSLLINAWLLCTAFFTILKTLELMLEIHLTEYFSFSLIKTSNSNSVVLSNAMEVNIPIIQHLACYDLYILSMSHTSLRWQIFTLSQPGGHPHTWNAILHESLKLIEGFICEIETICKVPEPVKQESPVPKHVHMRDMTLRQEEILTGPVPLSPVMKIRNLVDHPGRLLTKEPQKSAVDEFWLKVEAGLEKIKQNKLINYIFGTISDAKVRFLLSTSQPLIWVVQSLAELSASALLEDQFGIVLKDLPIIISTLLHLKSSLEKLGNIQNKFQKRDHDLCMKASLKSALKRSLYRIAIAYSEYLTDLPLSPENLKSMQNFVNFKEC